MEEAITEPDQAIPLQPHILQDTSEKGKTSGTSPPFQSPATKQMAGDQGV